MSGKIRTEEEARWMANALFDLDEGTTEQEIKDRAYRTFARKRADELLNLLLGK